MGYDIVWLEQHHLDKMVPEPLAGVTSSSLGKAYFSPGSQALCLLVEGRPVFAGGIVNLEWHRGEAWLLPTPYFRTHIKSCFRLMQEWLPKMAEWGGFVRVQATCPEESSEILFRHLGFEYEATLKHFGPCGETCSMFARLFGPHKEPTIASLNAMWSRNA